jgi:hypothetical protein
VEVLPDFYFVCSGRHGNRHSQKTVLILRDSRQATRFKGGKGKPIPTAPLPEGARFSENALENYLPRYVALTPDDRCYWINDEWPSRYWWRKASTPHAQLICPRCGLTKRLSVAQAAQILERYKDKGTFDIQKVP